jgi:hypothetical protein
MRADPEARATLAAAARRLVPGSDALGHIERALEYFVPWRASFAWGVRTLERIARDEWGCAFAELAGEDQDRILSFVQTGCAGEEGPAFVARLLELTLEVFLTSPDGRALIGRHEECRG